MRKHWRQGVLGMALAALAGCSTLHGAGTGPCQSQVQEKISAAHPQSRGTSFDSGSIERRRVGDNRIAISGRGKVKTAKGDYRAVTYSCVYNERSGGVSKVLYKIQ
ncbi:MAG: hypothetical protein SF182_12550 [Deltaproteobacteria bacterium]|nr:hypothetical protein [Deltaproteobacteria bacterium]